MTGTALIVRDAKWPHRPRRWTNEQIEEAIINTGGNFAEAAIYLRERYQHPCSRQLVSLRVNESPELLETMRHILATDTEIAWTGVKQRSRAGVPADQRFVIKQNEAKINRLEVSGPRGGPIELRSEITSDGVHSVAELEAMSDEDRQAVIRVGRLAQRDLAARLAAAASAG